MQTEKGILPKDVAIFHNMSKFMFVNFLATGTHNTWPSRMILPFEISFIFLFVSKEKRRIVHHC
jgi:hypothetical protein